MIEMYEGTLIIRKQMCDNAWELFEAWCAIASEMTLLTKEERTMWSEYYDHVQDCKECQSLRRNHGN